MHNELDWNCCTMKWTGDGVQWSGLEMMHSEVDCHGDGAQWSGLEMVHSEVDWKWCTVKWIGNGAQWSGLEMVHNEAETACLGVYFARKNGDIRRVVIAGPCILTPCQPHSVTSERDRTWFCTGFGDTNRPRRFDHHKKIFRSRRSRRGRHIWLRSYRSVTVERNFLHQTKTIAESACVFNCSLMMCRRITRWAHFSRAVLVERKMGGIAHLIIILYEQDNWLRSYRKCNNGAKDGWICSSHNYTIRAGYLAQKL